MKPIKATLERHRGDKSPEVMDVKVLAFVAGEDGPWAVVAQQDGTVMPVLLTGASRYTLTIWKEEL